MKQTITQMTQLVRANHWSADGSYSTCTFQTASEATSWLGYAKVKAP